MKKHNGIISIWKFIFSIVIVFYHCQRFYGTGIKPLFSGGYIAVEFFFIVSGYFFAKNTIETESKKIGIDTIKYVSKIIKNLLPYILISYFLLLIVIIFFDTITFSELINSIWYGLLFRQLGFRTIGITNQMWYLTAMIIVFLIMSPLLRKFKDNCICLISPLIVLLGLGYLNHNWIGLDHAYNIWDKFCYTGMYRALIEINIGMIIYEINKYFSYIDLKFAGKILSTILGEILLIICIIIIQFSNASYNYDYVMLLFISISILIITSEKTLELKYLSNNITYYLEKLSTPMFINHMFVILLINYNSLYISSSPVTLSVISLIITIVFSILELKVLKFFSDKKILIKIKNIFIN